MSFRSLFIFLQDIKIAHSVFALPFAIVGLALSHAPMPTGLQCFYLLLCMVTARSFAMGMNRYLDRKIDRKNPRTSMRMIPSGRLGARNALIWISIMGGSFVIVAFQLNFISGLCSFPVLCILAVYSLMKHISWLTHWYLGMCLGLAPIAVSIALTAQVSAAVIWIGLGVMFWTGGFDILYSFQDMNFDRNTNLKSVPVKFGARRAVLLSRLSFLGMIICLFLAGLSAGVGGFYFVGTALVALILLWEHWLVRDLKDKGFSKHLNMAFFTLNGWVSIVFCFMVVSDKLYKIL